MATEIKQKQTAAVTWKSTGGTQVMTFTSLATVTGRKGPANDFGATFCARVVIEFLTKFATGPVSGAIVEVWWCSSRDNTNFDGALASGDAAASDTDIHRMLRYVGALVADNTTAAQQQSWDFFLPGRYGFPVVFNRTAQSLSSTAGDHVLTVTGILDEIQ